MGAAVHLEEQQPYVRSLRERHNRQAFRFLWIMSNCPPILTKWTGVMRRGILHPSLSNKFSRQSTSNAATTIV